MAFLRETEYDPETGITKKWYIDGDQIVCHKEFDESPFLQQTQIARANTAGESFIGSRKAMHHMASIPPLVIEKIYKDHGINMMAELTPSEKIKLYRIIETEYPWCKTHEKKLWRPVKRKQSDGTV